MIKECSLILLVILTDILSLLLSHHLELDDKPPLSDECVKVFQVDLSTSFKTNQTRSSSYKCLYQIPTKEEQQQHDHNQEIIAASTWNRLEASLLAPSRSSIALFAEAKGVAGLGKAGGDGQGGSDKAGQQVPPEVYNALTYAGTAFLFTLSVPLILYGLNKLFNKIEDCFGCGPSSKKKKAEALRVLKSQQQQQQQQENNQPTIQQQQQQNQAQTKLQQLSAATINHNRNVSSQQHLLAAMPTPDSVAVTLPVDFEMNYKDPMGQLNNQHPYIISSPHL